MEQINRNTSWTSYPKVWNMGHAHINDLLFDPVIIQEKVDGSQFSFGVFGEELKIKSKGAMIDPYAPPNLFKEAVATVLRLHEEGTLVDGWTYRGEVLSRPKHNVLAYDRVPKDHIILFDISTGYEQYMSPDIVAECAAVLKLEVVPTLWQGSNPTMEMMLELLDRTSVLGGQKIEGIVIKNYSRFGIDGKPLFGKHVSEAFKEVHKGEWKEQNPTKGDVVARLITELRTPARWQKGVQHLAERNELLHEPKDIAKLVTEITDDVYTEEGERIKECLFKWAWPHICRGLLHGMPEWYKNELLKRQFDKEDSV